MKEEMETNSRPCLQNSMNKGAWWWTWGPKESDMTEYNTTELLSLTGILIMEAYHTYSIIESVS